MRYKRYISITEIRLFNAGGASGKCRMRDPVVENWLKEREASSNGGITLNKAATQ